MVRLLNWRDAARPATISLRPGSKARPSTILTVVWTLNALGVTPRSGTFASVPLRCSGWSTITSSSGEASGPSASRAMPGFSWISRA